MDRRLAALAVAAALAACQGEPKPQGVPVKGTVGSNAGLGAGVEVIYDHLGMPHIYAASDGDGAYALGYVHARDRLFQMDFQRRAGRGRLSELFGSSTLPEDVFLRTVFTGIRQPTAGTYEAGRVEHFIAQDLATRFPAVSAVLQRYADGVNRFLADLAAGANGARLPLEYLLATGGVPAIDPWTIEDSLAVGRLITFQLSFDLDVAFGQAAVAFNCAAPAATYDCAVLADLTRSAPAIASFVLPPAAPPPAMPMPAAVIASLAGASAQVPAGAWPFGPEKAGSNNWIVGGSRTATGMPLLANDPHLSLVNPPNFYLVELSTPTRDVAGVSFPGAPAVEIGHNGRVAWGATVTGYDVTDTFVETLQTAGVPTFVQHGGVGVYAATQILNETFGVRGGMTGCPAPCTVTVPIPVVPWHGPILPGSISGTTALSVQWTGQNPTHEVAAFWQLNGAGTVDEAFTALASFEVGAQNFVLADTSGNIGYDPHAWVPIRPAGCFPWGPMRGDGPCDWSGRIPDTSLPQAKNPTQGWLATANNDIIGSTADNNPLTPQYLYYTDDLGYRHARIAKRLTEKAGGYTLDDMTSIQAEVHSVFAEALVPALLAWWSSSTCATTGAAGSCAAALANGGGISPAVDLGPARDLLAAWATSGPQQFRTPTGLATSNPAGAASADAAERGAAAASMLFHALVPRLARRILDDDLARYGYSVNTWLDSQLVAKYLAALGGYARGTPPAAPLDLKTETAGASLCRVFDPGTATFGNQTCADMAVLALRDAVLFLKGQFGASSLPADWLWGRLHRTSFRSNLSSSTNLLDYGPFANDGGLYTVDVANFSWSNDGAGGFTQGSGPNVRFAAEVGPSSIRWRAVIPGGESGFPGDPNYMDQVPAWLANQPGDQPYGRAQVEAAAAWSLLFTP